MGEGRHIELDRNGRRREGMKFLRQARYLLRERAKRKSSRMLIGLDARTIYAEERRGIARSLLQMYSQLSVIRPNWKVIAYHREKEEVEQLLPEGWAEPKLIDMPGDRFNAWTKMRLPLAALQDGVDVLHCPANHCPRWMPVPTVVTVHDLIPIDMPHGQQPWLVKRFDSSVRCASARANAITCPSEYTRKRLIDDYHANGNKVVTTHWGATTQNVVKRVAEDEVRKLRHKYGITKPRYVLHFGAGEVRKNTRRLIKSWSMLPYQLLEDWQLVVVGLDARTLMELKKYAYGLHIEDTVLLHDFADEGDIPKLLDGAEVMAYPSLSEGFGLPLLEAFDAGTAVLTSDRTCLPEIAEDAAVFVDPTDAEMMAKTLGVMLDNEQLRVQLVNKGLSRLKDFSWERCAEQFASTLEHVVGKAKGKLAA